MRRWPRSRCRSRFQVPDRGGRRATIRTGGRTPVHRLRTVRLAALLVGLAMVAAACGGGNGGGGGGGTASQPKQGGSIVIAAEQWPECLSPITSCANASWLPWTGWQYVMPRLMEID